MTLMSISASRNCAVPSDPPRGNLPKLEFVVELVTPKMAEGWLEKNYQHQRPIQNAAVQRYAVAMKEGRWRLTHQGIAFSDTGKLLDGQSRLWAIIEAGVAVRMTVARGLAESSFEVLDQNRVRSVSDLARDVFITPQVVGAARSMARGAMQSYGTLFNDKDPQLLLQFIATHRPALELVMGMRGGSHVRGAKLLTAPVLGVLARASYHVPVVDLQRFVTVVMTGMTGDTGEKAAVLLRDYIASPRSRVYGGRNEQYHKTQRALKAFLEADPISALVGMKEDEYPLPGVGARRTSTKDAKRGKSRGAAARKAKRSSV